METEQAEGTGKGFVPPYVSFQTLNNFLDRLGKGPVPPRIDKGFLDNLSGGTQTMLVAALRSFGLTDEHGHVQPELAEMAADVDTRKQVLRDLLDRYYPEQMDLARRNGTSQQLFESFGKFKRISGHTLRKAIVFYLAAVDYAEAPKSPHFKPPKQAGPNARPAGRMRPGPDVLTAPAAEPEPVVRNGPALAGASSVHTITLVRGGTITLSISADMFSLDATERKGVFDLIDLLVSLDAANRADEEEEEEEDHP